MKLSSSSLEQSENLEQLRALENNMTIGVCYLNNIPISVDTGLNLPSYKISSTTISTEN